MLERANSRRSNSSYSSILRPNTSWLATQTEQHYLEILYTLHQEVQSLKLLAASKTKEVKLLQEEKSTLSKKHQTLTSSLKEKDVQIQKCSKIPIPKLPKEEIQEFQPLTFIKKPPSNSISSKLRKKIYG